MLLQILLWTVIFSFAFMLGLFVGQMYKSTSYVIGRFVVNENDPEGKVIQIHIDKEVDSFEDGDKITFDVVKQ